MCGLLGFITMEEHGYGTQDRKDFIRQAFIIDTLRGDDSCGMILVPHKPDGEADWAKAVGDGYSFTNNALYEERMAPSNLRNMRAVVGHNRAATQGSVNADNAHPFQEGSVTMVHNGTLRDDTVLEHDMTDLGVEVDSHAICHNLARATPDRKGVNSVVSKLDGAFTLIWHDSRDDSVNIVRNKERPLHLIEGMQERTLYFMSESRMLDLLVHRMKMNTQDTMYTVAPGTWLKWKAGNLVPETEELDLCEEWVNYGVTGNYHGYGNTYAPPATTATGWVRSPAATVYTSDTVHVGGRQRDVPASLQNQLLDADLLVCDRLQFNQLGYTPTSALTCVVEGWLGHDGTRAEIHGLSTTSAAMAMNRAWCARPIALKVGKGGEHIVVCKMVNSEWHSEMEVIGLRDDINAEKELDGLSGKRYDDGADAELLMGPNGTYLTIDAWVAATENGCRTCGLHPTTHDAEELQWFDDDRFICGTCNEDYLGFTATA